MVMGFFDNIAKKARGTVDTASKAYDDASKSIKEKTIGELIDSAIDAGSKTVSMISKAVFSEIENIPKGDIGNDAKNSRKSTSKVMTYEQRKLEYEKNQISDKNAEEKSRKSSHRDILDDILDMFD